MTSYRCPLDDKVFVTRRGYDTHKATHRPKKVGGYKKGEYLDAEPEIVEDEQS